MIFNFSEKCSCGSKKEKVFQWCEPCAKQISPLDMRSFKSNAFALQKTIQRIENKIRKPLASLGGG